MRAVPALVAAAVLAPTLTGPASAAADFRVVTPRENVPVIYGTPRVELVVPVRAELSIALNGAAVEHRFRRSGARATGRLGPAQGLVLGRNTLVVRATQPDGRERRATRHFYGVRRDPTMVAIARPRAGALVRRRALPIVFDTGTPIVILRAWVNGREVTGRLTASRATAHAAVGRQTVRGTVPASFLRRGGNVLKVRAIGSRGRYETEFRPFRVRGG